ncbi:hypothetical protein BCR44DRAFT_1423804 [Catenaria anguillulae PL171]|uniref:50S ribosomal protein L35 n=1 Tax=Catenaria anguillulae PL171 TaxID=765915 RepID=A0A1Y2I1P6_9FUNG|nr:hypothetical protein BCR44DRAFT_1423804 [Catenaria anguillulae PL171]
MHPDIININININAITAKMSFLLSPLAATVRSATSLVSSAAWSPFATPVRSLSKYKLKTHKGASKRWLAVGNDREFKRMKVNKAHLNVGMANNRFHRLSQMMEPHGKAMRRTLRRLMPYAQ